VTVLTGIGVCPGVVAGPVVRMPEPVSEPEPGPAPGDPTTEAARIRPAMGAVAADLRSRAAEATGETKAVLEATAFMAADPGLADLAEKGVLERGQAAPRAVWEAANSFRDLLAAAGGYVGARATDVEDVRNRIVAVLLGVPVPGVPDPGPPVVLVARDLAPADTATIAPDRVLGFVTAEGGPTSHTAILARALGIPAVVSCADVLDVPDGSSVVLDGTAGTLDTSPTDRAVEDANTRAARRRAAAHVWHGQGGTSDGRRVQLLANVGDTESARAAAAAGAEGVGLFRTEFLFLDSTTEPTVATQRAAYSDVFAAFPGRKVVVRTLDAGADKPLPFLDQGEEPNPALGVRGLRIGLAQPGVLDRQLEAIAAAASESDAEVWVMAPMVAVAEEAAQFAARATAAGLGTVGVMVEIPSAALTARHLLEVVDFASLGTNDLAQYAMAADRMSGALAALNDPWQPALLRLVEMAGSAGEATGRPVGVCGEAAADPALAVVLVGLGVTSLSMSARAIPDVGALLASVPLEECRRVARLAVEAADAASGRAAVRAELPGLADLGL
jgi:phosphotransferase system enzyme I (PtsI)